LNEAVEHGKTGLLVKAEDVDELRGAIATLIDDEATRRQMGAAGKERMRQEFSIAAMADQHVALYESL
jgi:glycosyltransferase involved in cell wall biosynthesis